MRNAGEGMERREPSHTVGWNGKWFLPPLWRTNGASLKSKHRAAIIQGLHSWAYTQRKLFIQKYTRTLMFDPRLGKIPWRRERLPTPVLWPGEFHGLYSPWGCKESDRTERLSLYLLTTGLNFTANSQGNSHCCLNRGYRICFAFY